MLRLARIVGRIFIQSYLQSKPYTCIFNEVNLKTIASIGMLLNAGHRYRISVTGRKDNGVYLKVYYVMLRYT